MKINNWQVLCYLGQLFHLVLLLLSVPEVKFVLKFALMKLKLMKIYNHQETFDSHMQSTTLSLVLNNDNFFFQLPKHQQRHHLQLSQH